MASHVRPSSAWFATQRPMSRGDVTIVAALLAVGIAVPAAIAAWLGAFDIPRNDSWSYRRVLWEFVGRGHVRLVGWSGMTMVGQVFWTAPFVEILGKAQWVPGAAVAVASAIGLVCAYALARSLLPRGLGRRVRAFDTGRPGRFAEHLELHDRRDGIFRRSGLPRVRGGRIAPLWPRALGPGGSCGRHGVLRLQHPRVRLGGARRCPGGPGGARPAGLAGLRDCRPRRDGGLRPDLSLDCPVTGSSPRVAQPADGHVAPPAPCLVFHIQLHHFATSTLGADSCLAVPRATGGAVRAGAVAAAVFLGLGTLSLAKGWGLFVGNYLMQQGVTGAAVLSGARPNLFPGAVWLSLQIVALLAGTALAFVAFACLATREAATQLFSGTIQSLVAWFALLSAGGLLAYGLLVKAPLFDRYLSQLAFPVAVLLARSCLVSRDHHPPHPCSRTDGPRCYHWQGWHGRDSGSSCSSSGRSLPR